MRRDLYVSHFAEIRSSIQPGSFQLTNPFVALDGLVVATTNAKLLFHRSWKYEAKDFVFWVTAGLQSKSQAMFCFV